MCQLFFGRNFADCSISLIDGNVRVGVAIGVGIRNMNAAERLPSNYAGTIGIWLVQWFKQRVVLVGVTVRPAIHGNPLNVSSGVESAAGEHTSKLIANVALECFEWCSQQLVTPGSILIFCGQTRLARGAQKMKQTGVLWRAGEMILADRNREIERGAVEETARRVD